MSAPRVIRVLLADDHQVVREGMRMILGDLPGAGAQIEIGGEAVPGEDAVSQSATAADVVLMDLQMPRLDGIEAARRIRAAVRREAS